MNARRTTILVSTAAVIAAGAYATANWCLGGSSVTRNMQRAENHIGKLEPILAPDKRFQHISLHVYSGLDGSMSVNGDVATPDDLAALQKIVEASHPPVQVLWRVNLRAVKP